MAVPKVGLRSAEFGIPVVEGSEHFLCGLCERPTGVDNPFLSVEVVLFSEGWTSTLTQRVLVCRNCLVGDAQRSLHPHVKKLVVSD